MGFIYSRQLDGEQLVDEIREIVDALNIERACARLASML